MLPQPQSPPAQHAELLQVYSLAKSPLKHLDQDLMTLSFPRFFKFLSDGYAWPLPEALCVPSAGLGHALLPPDAHPPVTPAAGSPSQGSREDALSPRRSEVFTHHHAPCPCPPWDPQSSELPCIFPCISHDRREGHPGILYGREEEQGG